jgi:hypothetical protein
MNAIDGIAISAQNLDGARRVPGKIRYGLRLEVECPEEPDDNTPQNESDKAQPLPPQVPRDRVFSGNDR